jgi:hypothetical protein
VAQPLELVTKTVALLLELAAQNRVGRIGHRSMLLPCPRIGARLDENRFYLRARGWARS